MKKLAFLLIGALMVAVIFSAACVEEEVTPTPTPTEVPAESPTLTPTAIPTPTPTPTPTPSVTGVVDPDIYVDINEPEMTCNGTTLLPDNHNPERPRVIEVNMLGEIVWEYVLPDSLKQYTNPGFDVELLPDNNILILCPGMGVYEIDRNGSIVWSYLDDKVSHDADRLPNGNTLVVYGNEDQISDAQVKEINPEGEIVWSWYARDHFYTEPYEDIYNQGWTHTNAAIRLENGDTLISPRNFNFLVEVNPEGEVVEIIGDGILHYQHDPEVLSNGNVLVANPHFTPEEVVEIDSETGEIIWRFVMPDSSTWPIRDANRLPIGNTLITGTTQIVEVTADGQIVWRLRLRDITFPTPEEGSRLGFYKAERICTVAP